jgi:hypothetical protein
VKKEKFPPKYFHNDRKGTLNSKYSTPKKVLKVEKGSATLEVDKDFLKDTRVNVTDLKKVIFRNEEERKTLEENQDSENEEGGGGSIMA